ncbi:NmrA family NAD(P)-binding protein [Lentzea sp.]|uniref:NmrA family NAD(P)-binding protein n=1 Tax=Lentzea sp. TaxID=56099 RepID=UPI002CDF5E6C|nr:NmrA family NAD(P)-binding protein [Lentzea sp.]HUQ60837.1 NmrA family NAD(P)-binding protein [Lentzea sp.]
MTQEILVLGATGKTGRRVVDALKAAGATVRAASRSSAVRFDWSDESTWQPALSGTTAAYVIAPHDPAAAAPFVAQAEASGVRLVLLSGKALDEIPNDVFAGMHAAEAAVRASGLPWTILRANNFAQNFSEELWQQGVRAGRLALPVDDTPEPFVDVQDIAEVAALVLTSEDHDGQTYNLTGPAAITFDTAVAKISSALGRTVELVKLTPDEYRETLLSEGLSENDATELNGMYEAMRKGLLATPTDDVSRLLGREATDFDTYVAGALDAWR